MTREEAIKILKPMLDSFVDYANITMKVEDDNTVDALEMAIEALKQPEIIYCKDCKHKGTKNCVANAWTTIFGVTVKDDFYCGLARKENR